MPRLIPPVWFLLAATGMVALDRFLPLVDVFGPALRAAGVLPAVAGIALAVSGVLAFRRADTPVRPFQDVTTLVTDGAFARTRNPMYLGMVLVLCGVATGLGSISPWLVLPVFVWLIRRLFISKEEAILAQQFPEDYAAYCARVGRWF